VATFLGSPPMNFLDGHWRQGTGAITLALPSAGISPAAARIPGPDSDEPVSVGFRPEDVHPLDFASEHAELTLRGRIVLEEPLGHETLTHIDVEGREIVARGRETFPRDGEGAVRVRVPAGNIHLFSARDGRRIARDRAG
jgi:multiple sugar transport system ATP-binding protein